METTAAFDAHDWSTYWASGDRDLRILLEVVRREGSLPGRGCAVDLGCGLGRLSRRLAVEFDMVIGLDISPEMVRKARELSPLPNVTYDLVRQRGRLPLADRSADLAIAWTVFRHMSKASFAAYLVDLRRVLKPGGWLAFESQVREDAAGAEPPDHDPFAEREYSTAELRRYCAEAKFVWRAERRLPSATPATETLVVGWQVPE